MYKIRVINERGFKAVTAKAARNRLKININRFSDGTADIFVNCTKEEWKKLR